MDNISEIPNFTNLLLSEINSPKLETILENNEGEQEIELNNIDMDINLELQLDDRLKKQSQKMNNAYLSIVKKHKTYNELNKINDLKRLSVAEEDLIESQLNNISVNNKDPERQNYWNKRSKIRSSGSSNGSKENNLIVCEADYNGTIYKHKKVFLLNKEIISELGSNTNIIGVKDIIDISKIPVLHINIITVLVNNGKNVDEIKELLAEEGKHVKIYARIETSEAIFKFDEILEKADGIVIQHGLLSSKISYEDLCTIETYIIERCKLMHKPILLQANILKSMTYRIRPTMTEISNIDSAVNSGIDGLILKEEVTMAHNYMNIIKTLKNILSNVEIIIDNKHRFEELARYFKVQNNALYFNNTNNKLEPLLASAVKTTYDADIQLILLYTDNYIYSKALSKYQPHCRIICATSDDKVFDYMRLIRGVTPFLVNISDFEDVDKLNVK